MLLLQRKNGPTVPVVRNPNTRFTRLIRPHKLDFSEPIRVRSEDAVASFRREKPSKNVPNNASDRRCELGAAATDYYNDRTMARFGPGRDALIFSAPSRIGHDANQLIWAVFADQLIGRAQS